MRLETGTPMTRAQQIEQELTLVARVLTMAENVKAEAESKIIRMHTERARLEREKAGLL